VRRLSTETTADGEFLVTGATGPHGGAVVRALATRGHRVRALTRNPDSPAARSLAALGAQLAVGDLLDSRSLVGAMRGTTAVYAVTTPFGEGTDAEISQGEQIIIAADRAGVPWLVLASVASADRGTGIPHFESKWQIEQQLEASGLAHSVVAPTYFYENLGDPRQVLESDELELPLPASRPLQQIALSDLGAVVASLLMRQPEFMGERLELAGDQPRPAQMASALSAARGRPVSFREIPIDVVAARNPDIAAMYQFLATTGYGVDIDAVRARFPEVSWTTFAQWADGGVT
jgi:uncharacterized protein YbjT (DUF2867 family)